MINNLQNKCINQVLEQRKYLKSKLNSLMTIFGFLSIWLPNEFETIIKFRIEKKFLLNIR